MASASAGRPSSPAASATGKRYSEIAGSFGPTKFLLDRQGPLQMGLGLGIASHPDVGASQVAEADHHVVAFILGLIKRERLLERLDGLGITTQGVLSTIPRWTFHLARASESPEALATWIAWRASCSASEYRRAFEAASN